MNIAHDVYDLAKNWYTAATWTEKDIPDLEVRQGIMSVLW
jgi:hypothetical protein